MLKVNNYQMTEGGQSAWEETTGAGCPPSAAAGWGHAAEDGLSGLSCGCRPREGGLLCSRADCGYLHMLSHGARHVWLCGLCMHGIFCADVGVVCGCVQVASLSQRPASARCRRQAETMHMQRHARYVYSGVGSMFCKSVLLKGHAVPCVVVQDVCTC